jgi:CheY-like chemotaxis protein
VLEDTTLARELGQARLAAERARDHVAQLLAFSRPQRGDRRLLVPAEVVDEAVQLLRPNLPSSIAVHCEGIDDDAVPPMVADPVQFEQVLFNLFINARDAVDGHGTLCVRIAHVAADGHCASCGAHLDGGRWVAFEVEDDGRGMTRDVLDRMFEPFFTTKEVGRGTGMGLAMVHGIVHDHGGHLQVRSSPGAGSLFRVLMPVAAQEPEPDITRAMASAAAPHATAPLHGRVLVVEDEASVGEYMRDLLSGWGLDVVVEQDPLSAARRLAGHDEAFSLLLSDQTMPGMTGIALARHAREHRPGLPVLLYTGNASDIRDGEVTACGVARLLRKPIDAGALRSLLRDLLRASAAF